MAPSVKPAAAAAAATGRAARVGIFGPSTIWPPPQPAWGRTGDTHGKRPAAPSLSSTGLAGSSGGYDLGSF